MDARLQKVEADNP
jgi:hypothetical protein